MHGCIVYQLKLFACILFSQSKVMYLCNRKQFILASNRFFVWFIRLYLSMELYCMSSTKIYAFWHNPSTDMLRHVCTFRYCTYMYSYKYVYTHAYIYVCMYVYINVSYHTYTITSNQLTFVCFLRNCFIPAVNTCAYSVSSSITYMCCVYIHCNDIFHIYELICACLPVLSCEV